MRCGSLCPFACPYLPGRRLVRGLSGDGQINFYSPPGRDPWWFCGDCEKEGDDATDVVGPLLAQWDQFHPAIEWLVRELGVLFVERRTNPKGKRSEASTPYRLASGEHFGPLPEGHSFSSIRCAQADPASDLAAEME